MTTLSTIKKLAASAAIASSLGFAALSLGTAVAAAAPSTDSGSSTSSSGSSTTSGGKHSTPVTTSTSGNDDPVIYNKKNTNGYPFDSDAGPTSTPGSTSPSGTTTTPNIQSPAPSLAGRHVLVAELPGIREGDFRDSLNMRFDGS